VIGEERGDGADGDRELGPQLVGSGLGALLGNGLAPRLDVAFDVLLIGRRGDARVHPRAHRVSVAVGQGVVDAREIRAGGGDARVVEIQRHAEGAFADVACRLDGVPLAAAAPRVGTVVRLLGAVHARAGAEPPELRGIEARFLPDVRHELPRGELRLGRWGRDDRRGRTAR
jgi:hypothetical protein